MPSPWDPNRFDSWALGTQIDPSTTRGCLIDLIENRAITIQQLRDVRLLLQRLSKAHLLRRTNGRALHWFEVNMYDIRDCIIKPVIQHQAGGERSWVELVASAEQPPLMLFSHSWSGRFRDFMSVVDEVARTFNLSGSVGIWICTFACCQFGEDFGTCLSETPFGKAVMKSKRTILVVDRDASSLSRSWCGAELYLTAQEDKPLNIFTPAGQVGSRRVQSGPLVQAIEQWDITLCEASEDADRRQILNCVAGVPELTEIRSAEEGDWRRTLLSNQPTDARTRGNGLKEYCYEAQLFSDSSEQSENLNSRIRNKVMASAMKRSASHPEERKLGERITRLDDRGLSLGQFRKFVGKLKHFVVEKLRVDWKDFTIRDHLFPEADWHCGHSECPRESLPWSLFWEYHCHSLTDDDKQAAHLMQPGEQSFSYMETVSDSIQTPQFIVHHAWQAPFQDTLASVEWYAEARQLGDDATLW